MPRAWTNGLLAAWVTTTLGVPFLLISIAGRALPADVLACVRFGLGCATLLAVMAVRRGAASSLAAMGRLLRASPVEMLVVGVCSAALPSVLITVGEHHVPTGVVSLLLAGTPVWVAVGGHVVLPDERLKARQVACLALALGGLAVLTTGGSLKGASPWALLPVAAAMSYAVGNLLVRARLRKTDPLTLTCTQMLVATAASAPFALAHATRPDGSLGPWLAALVLGAACSGLGWLANTVLIQRVDAVRASLVSFAAPLVSVLLGVVVLDERLSPARLAAAGVVLSAVAAYGLVSRPGFRGPFARKGQAMLETAVLGFLAERPMHAFELRKQITALMGHVRPVSDGSLYPAVRRLEERGLLTRRVEPGSRGPARYVLALTDDGRAELRRRLADPDDVEITDRNRYFTILAFLHLLPSAAGRAEVLRRRLAFLDDPKRGFFVTGDRALRQDELDSPFRAGIQHIARVTSSAERAWLAETLAALETGKTPAAGG
jgi:drug/metabolite transporter (DMT)-like permease/DNA-binding PadR family transcriptional regulator